jgi:hypothetical protein
MIVGFRSPRVKRRRISRVSSGDASREEVNDRRVVGLPIEEEDAQASSMDWRVGAYIINTSV